MALYREEGMVIRTRKLGEADHIVTVFTKHRGILDAVAKGVRKTSSHFGGRLQPFSHIDFQCYEGRNLDTFTQVESIALYGARIGEKMDLFGCACTVAELAQKIGYGDSSAHQYHLFCGAIRTIAQQRVPAVLARDSYVLRALAFAGWRAELARCVHCGRLLELGEIAYCSPERGGVLCKGCRMQLASGFELDPQARALMMQLAKPDWHAALTSSSSSRAKAAECVLHYAQWHLDTVLKSSRATNGMLNLSPEAET